MPVVARLTALAAALVSVCIVASPAAADPALSVPEAKLDAALDCVAPARPRGREPVLLVHGTSSTPEENWGWSYLKVLPERGYDVCTVRLPNRAFDDIQVSSEYVVHAIVTMAARYDRKVDILGHSQGGLQPRWAVRWWETARAEVDDLVTLATPNHGTVTANAACVNGCSGAIHQMKQGSAFLAALNAPDETPGDVSYTSVYSNTDELVQPVAPEPTAAFDGASNIAIQDVCPGRAAEHGALAGDAVAYALVVDAFTNPGPADAARFERVTCLKPWIDGVDGSGGPAITFDALFGARFRDYRALPQEPPLAPYARPDAAAQPAVEPAPATAGSPGAAPVAAAPELPRTGGAPPLLLWSLPTAAGVAGMAVRRRL